MWNIIGAIQAIGKIIDLIKSVASMISEYLRKKQVKEAQEKIDVSHETGDQRAAEEALGNPNPGAPTVHSDIDGLQTRPVKKRN